MIEDKHKLTICPTNHISEMGPGVILQTKWNEEIFETKSRGIGEQCTKANGIIHTHQMISKHKSIYVKSYSMTYKRSNCFVGFVGSKSFSYFKKSNLFCDIRADIFLVYLGLFAQYPRQQY